VASGRLIPEDGGDTRRPYMTDAERPSTETSTENEEAVDMRPEEERADATLEAPSTSQEPGEEPRADEPQVNDDASHHAVGIGVIDAEIPGEEGAPEAE
jgi:hypothetical protein